MRRGGTLLVFVVVAAIAIAASVDALRGESSSGPERSTVSTTPDRQTETAPPEEAFGGLLYYTDESCDLRAVELPTRQPAEAPSWRECRFVLSADGYRVSEARSGWDPRSDPLIGRLFQTEEGKIQVATNRGPEGEPFRGQAAAWRPDGTLTYVADGVVREWPSRAEVLSQTDLAEAVLAHPDVPDTGRIRPIRVKEIGWLDDARLVTILDASVGVDRTEDFVAVFEGREMIAVHFGGTERLSDLTVSPRGGFVALRLSGEEGFLLLDAGGSLVPPPPLTSFRAIAFSPNDLWAAAATDAGVYVFLLGSQSLSARLDIDAYDLAWRGPAGAPPLEGAEEARAWLGGLGATGRLFVNEPGCRLRALRLPNLVWEEEPDAVLAPCRFSLTADDEPVDETVALQPGGDLRAYCEGDDLEVYTPGESGETIFPDACAPAWMPNGRLTFIREGELYAGEAGGAERLLISRDDLRSMFGREAALEEVAWIDDARLWGVVRFGGGAIVAAMTTERLVYSPTFTTRWIEELCVSATGMVAARTDRGVVFFDSGGRRALTFPNGQAVSWAPDALVAAVATRREILFVAPVSRDVVALPLAAMDLEWVVP